MAPTSADPALLGIYLNDHLAGATAGTELAKRLAGAERGHRGEAVLSRLADEIADDRNALLTCMAALEVPVRQYKTIAAWAGEKLARLKPNGRLVSRSPLSRVEELEMLRLGVEGKAAGWRTLRARAGTDPRLDAGRLDDLIDRARRQIDELEELRVRAVAEAFGGATEPVKPSAGGEGRAR
ncbi:hypothetical protein [Amycolatopsis orientalis]|uniref:hypothetical protein n=1 Tax=Amycolatopsis orientalis TaxID=31958 RepID=UPI000686F9FE|nr:hypothetical protein [Amycolatopsis orientalis]